MKITTERFEAWLSTVPDDYEIDYGSTEDCVVCQFVKATTSERFPTCGPFSLNLWNESHYVGLKQSEQFPEWLYNLLWNVRITYGGNPIITGRKLRAEWRKLFPDHEPLQETAQETAAHTLSARVETTTTTPV